MAAGTRRKHRSALAGDTEANSRALKCPHCVLQPTAAPFCRFCLCAGAATVTKLAKTRSLADARVVVCAGAMLPEAQLQPSNTEYRSGRMRLGRCCGSGRYCIVWDPRGNLVSNPRRGASCAWPSSVVARPAPAQRMPWLRHRRAQEPQTFSTALIEGHGALLQLGLFISLSLSLQLGEGQLGPNLNFGCRRASRPTSSRGSWTTASPAAGPSLCA